MTYLLQHDFYDSYFIFAHSIIRQSREVGPHKQVKEDAESVTQQLLILVQYTAVSTSCLFVFGVISEIQFGILHTFGFGANFNIWLSGVGAELK